MQKPLRQSVARVLLVNLASTGPTWAQSLSDEARLQAAHKGIDNDAAEHPNKDKAKSLAKQFRVPTKVIDELQRKKLGWGELIIQLTLARHLAKTDQKTYPTFTSARQKVEDLRNKRRGWGTIAKELGLRLGPVLSQVQHVRKELHTEIRSGRSWT